MIVLWITLSVLGVVTIAIAAIGAYFFVSVIGRKGIRVDLSEGMPPEGTAWHKYYDMIKTSIDYLNCPERQEIVSIRSDDGLILKGRLYTNLDKSNNFILFMHGWKSTGFNDGAVIVEYYVKQGYNVLLVDQRSRGMSQGKYACFGIKERYDCLEWVNYLNNRFGKDNIKIVLEGISMGASTVMMAAGLDLPDNVVGLLADCGFTSPYEQFRHVARKSMKVPAFPLLNVFGLYCKIFAGFDIRACDTRDTLSRSKLPIAMIHGGDDRFVPTSMSVENYEAAAGEKFLKVVPGAGHGVAYLADPEGVLTYLDEFLKKCFGKSL